MEGLARLMAKAPSDVEVVVEFVRPDDVPDGWEKTEHWRRAAAIPGVTAHCDVGGIHARRMRTTTSGHLMAVDATGTTVFSGGITPARGRGGPSVGQRALEALLTGREPEATETPVFGCPLFSSDECLRENREGVACP